MENGEIKKNRSERHQVGRTSLDEVMPENPYSEKAKEGVRISVPAKNVQKFREVLLYDCPRETDLATI